ncbi:MAG TPA: hypothetical protein VEU62_14530 [Bryobacterales bacterium]|nr:hypothetical protein [Bryobacterales bacterium]
MTTAKAGTFGRQALLCAGLFCSLMVGLGRAQTTVPSAGLKYIQTIPVPTWTNTGSKQANYDLFAFNPQSRVMYVADRVNHAVTAVDTRTNAVIGVMVLPSGAGTNGVLIAPDLQLLIATDGKFNVFVYNLRVPDDGPDIYPLPGIGGGTDALDYDPLNRTVYVINGSAPYYITGINLEYKEITTQFLLPVSPELLKFNPVDGLIYQATTDGDNKGKNKGVYVYDPVANAIKATYLTPTCTPHGIDIDPVANAALIACDQGATLMSLKDGSILKQFDDVTGTDLLQFNPNNGRFYTGSSGNKSTTTGCPMDTTKSFPVIGVMDARGGASTGVGELVGVTCSGRNSKVGVDPIDNFVYVGTRQYPVNASDGTTGSNGVLLFYDPAPPAQPLTTLTQASLDPIAAGGPKGSVTLHLVGRSIRLDASVQGVMGKTALINVPTTIGNEVVECGIDYNTDTTVCNGNLLGDPLVGATAMLGVDGAPAARGLITVPAKEEAAESSR